MSDSLLALVSLEGLIQQAVRALAFDYEAPTNGQIRAMPDTRTIRYYTTLGLLDRPALMRGRTALYSRRHLLQIVAIKRLQAQGLTLSAIQQRLLGATETALSAIARLPAESANLESAPDAVESPGNLESQSQARNESFWKQQPSPAPAARRQASARTTPREPTVLQAVSLADNVTLLLPLVRPIVEADLGAIHTAIRPLLDQLNHLGLWQAPAEPGA